MANKDYIRQNNLFMVSLWPTQDISDKRSLFKAIQCLIGPIQPIQVSPIGPGNHQGYPWVQPNIYKNHYRGLYDQLRLYQAKLSNRSFQALLRLYNTYIGEAYWPIMLNQAKQPIYGIYIWPTQAISDKKSLFKAIQCLIGPIQLSPIGPGNHQGYLWVEPDIYKVQYRSLYNQLRLYQAKSSYLGQNRPFLDLFRLYRLYIGGSYRAQ